MRRILLSNGEWTLVSDEDYIFLVGYNWAVSGGGYAYTKTNNKVVYLHKIIAERIGFDCSNEIDHINQNKLDNQRENLRAATHSQNGMNQGKYRNNASGYKGVFWRTQKQKWCAEIQISGVKHYLGLYNTKEAAAFAYKIAAKKHHKEFANAGA